MVTPYPNYRLAVELVLLHENRILLTKRAADASLRPGAWHVPAGKVKYEEIPLAALSREAKEEINLAVIVVRELDARAFKADSKEGEVYRCIFTYLVNAAHNDLSSLKLNDEHTDYAWVSKQELMEDAYPTLHPNLRKAILCAFD